MRRYWWLYVLLALVVAGGCNRFAVRTPSYDEGATPEPQRYRREAPGPQPPARPPLSPPPVTPPPTASLSPAPVMPSPTFSPVLPRRS